MAVICVDKWLIVDSGGTLCHAGQISHLIFGLIFTNNDKTTLHTLEGISHCERGSVAHLGGPIGVQAYLIRR